MGFDDQDKEVVRLLTKLKEADGKYPPDLLSARRQKYLQQMGEIGLGIGAGLKIKNALSSAKAPTLSSATSTILESALVVAIVAETGTVAYFYRDKLADLFQSITKEERVQEVTPPPAHTEPEIQGVTSSPALAATVPSSTLSLSPTGVELSNTPIPNVVENNNIISANSTPAPNNVNNVNNGNHYGQTPRPQRTKEPKNNNNNDTPPKDNSKPPKTK
jgi:hypothetical protein